MAVTRLKRKGRRNKQTATVRRNTIKQLTAKPVVKNVDLEELKSGFAVETKEEPKAKESEKETKEKVSKAKEESPKEETPKAKATKKDTPKSESQEEKKSTKATPKMEKEEVASEK